MRSRSMLLPVALLLVTASLAYAAEPAGPMTPAPERASANPACNPLLAKLGISLAPASHDKISLVCGPCSVAVCQGASYGVVCQGGTSVKRCLDALGGICSDGSPQCQCWSGPFP